MQKIIIRTSIAGVVVLAVLTIGYFFGLNTMLAKAAQLVFSPRTCYTDAATSSPAYLTVAGAAVNATSTVTCNLGGDGAERATVIAQFTASSTNTIYNFEFEESQDGVDWYPIASREQASTTNPFFASHKMVYKYQFASSSPGAGVLGYANQATSSIVFDIPVRLQQVRVSAYLATTTGATTEHGAVWMKIVPRLSVN